MRYYSSKLFKTVFKHSDVITKTIIKPLKAWKSVESPRSIDRKTIKLPDVNNTFPMEVWELIVNFGDLKCSTILLVNKTFFHVFVPKLYDTLHLTIIISSLTKMKLNDDNFLRNGFDRMDQTGDSFFIYERRKASASFVYEFIDFEIYDHHPLRVMESKYKSYVDNSDNQSQTLRSNKPVQVRNITAIKHILKNIVQNPNSIMKGFLKEILVDICVLDEFDKIFDNDSHTILTELIQEREESKECLVMRTDGPAIGIVPYDDNFERVRWNDWIEVRERQGKYMRKDNLGWGEPLMKIFPYRVYFKKLLMVYILSEASYLHRLRRGLFNFEDHTTLAEFNPIKSWPQKIRHCFKHTEESSTDIFQMTFNAQLSVIVKDRILETNHSANEVLRDIIETFTTDKYSLTAQSSVFIAGVNDGKPQLSEEFTVDAAYSDYWHDTMIGYKTKMILLNKPPERPAVIPEDE